MSDFIDETFASLDEYYPGSRRKRKSVEPAKAEEPREVNWDSRPYVKTMPNGTNMELFTIGALATALDRPIITVRDWVKKGYLPTAPYRMPSTTNKNGDSHQGRRLYSRAMIEAVVEIFDKADLLSLERIEWNNHKKIAFSISERWNTIRMQETNTANNANQLGNTNGH